MTEFSASFSSGGTMISASKSSSSHDQFTSSSTSASATQHAASNAAATTANNSGTVRSHKSFIFDKISDMPAQNIWNSPVVLPSLNVSLFTGSAQHSQQQHSHYSSSSIAPPSLTSSSTSSSLAGSASVISRPKVDSLPLFPADLGFPIFTASTPSFVPEATPQHSGNPYASSFFGVGGSDGNSACAKDAAPSSRIRHSLSSFYDADAYSSVASLSCSVSDLDSYNNNNNKCGLSALDSRSIMEEPPGTVMSSSRASPRIMPLSRSLDNFSIEPNGSPSQLEAAIEQLQARITSKKQLLSSLQQDIVADEALIARLTFKLSTFKTAAGIILSSQQTVAEPKVDDAENQPLPEPSCETHLETPEIKSPTESRHHDEALCRKWNRGECFKGSHCSHVHECLRCAGPHPRVKCSLVHYPSSADSVADTQEDEGSVDESDYANEACIKWNHKKCLWGEKCHRQHLCMNCGQPHRILECPALRKNYLFDDSVCMNWNEGRCRMGDRCKRAHKCNTCGSAKHQSLRCENNTSASFIEDGSVQESLSSQQRFSDICLNWNNGRCSLASSCKRSHQCSVCDSSAHPAICCTQATSADDLIKGGIDTCWNWNLAGCDDVVYPLVSGNVKLNSLVGSCKRIHACNICRSARHSAVTCKETPSSTSSSFPVDKQRTLSNGMSESHRQKLMEICLNWNEDRCKLGERCKRIHACGHCFSLKHVTAKCDSANGDSLDPFRQHKSASFATKPVRR